MQATAISMDRLVERVRAEFHEMPGLRLTEPQARRLLAIERETCETVLNSLVRAGVLRRLPDGSYVRN